MAEGCFGSSGERRLRGLLQEASVVGGSEEGGVGDIERLVKC